MVHHLPVNLLENINNPENKDVGEERNLSHRLAILSGFLRDEINESSSISERCAHLRKRIQVFEEALVEVGRLEPALRCLQNISAASTLSTRISNIASSTCPRKISISQTHTFPEEDEEDDESIVSSPIKRRRITTSSTSSPPTTPCIRCKILKKHCDSLFPSCSQCPTQTSSFNPPSTPEEFWKVLGCLQQPLTSLSAIFCPPFSRSTTRKLLRSEVTGVGVINFILITSRVSLSKKRRIEDLLRRRMDFMSLSAIAWDNINERKEFSLAAVSVSEMNGTDEVLTDTEEYEAPWAVLQCVALEKCYLEKTAYNFFTLMRLGNEFSAKEPVSWELYIIARKLLRQSVELYLLERLCAQVASGEMIGPALLDSTSTTPNTLVLVDLLDDVEEFLRNFEKICSLRGKLTGHLQLGCFYALLVFGITKSILADAYSVRPEYEDPNPWTENYSIRISSAYKVLVSVFCWSSKEDVVLQEVVNEGSELTQSLLATQNMVHSDLWEERGFKATKDFLLGLGSCYFLDGTYNGFFVQKFGRERLDTFVRKPQSENTRRQAPSFMMNTFRVLEQSPTPSESTVEESSRLVFVGQDSPKRQSKRKGALNAATLEHAREVRKIGACWNCWAIKVTCSEGTKCDRCEHKIESKSYKICNRGPFRKLTDIFFPDFLSSAFSLEETKEYITQNTSGFSDSSMEIEIVWGRWSQIPIKLQARIFTPVPNGLVQYTYQSRAGEPLGVGSLPVGLVQDDVGSLDLERKCLEHLRSSLHAPSFLAQVPERKTFPLSTSVWKILLDFHEAEQNSLLENSFMLYLSICATSRPVVFTDSTAISILEETGSRCSPTTAYSSRILNKQIKDIMFKICYHLLAQVLDEWERIIRKRSKESWPILFATLTILCFCIEEIQFMIVIHIHTATSPLDGEPQRACQSLEDIPYGQLSSVFHNVYRTVKADNGGFNPFKENFDFVHAGFSVPALAMVHEITGQILSGSGKENLIDRRKPLEFGDEFAKRNSGHLVASFLLFFMKQAGKSKSSRKESGRNLEEI